MNESHMSPAYDEGMEQFLQFAVERSRPDENVKFFLSVHNKKNYTTWIWHGELKDMQSRS